MKGYTLLDRQTVQALSAEGYLWRHDVSGARVFYLRNKEDDNKVFQISFCTPPEDNTGIPHILEHSVLCGSDRYPLKDPFIQLAKGSLNTFLNAMTFSDKTMYPVASQNDKDFLNLMDVYMDAVFHPAILKEPRTLMQEGWHYEIEDDLSALGIKGVVYNEMKGAFSSPEEVLFSKIRKELYPDTPYRFESGGDPEAIPELTYERFIEYYKAHYQPSNSCIYIYGDGDMEEHLRYLDERYLADLKDTGVRYSLPMQKPFEAPRRAQGSYPVTSDESTENKAYLSYNTVYGPVTDPLRYYASGILEYMLLETEGAPLKKALQEAGIGEDIFGMDDNSMLQPTFSIVVRNADPAKEELFVETVRKTLASIVENGWSRDMLTGALNRSEFRLREGDFGSTPAGLIFGITCMDTWLHGESPMTLLHFDRIFAELRKKAENGYFEDLIKTILLDNPHTLIYTLLPEAGLTAKQDQALKEKLQKLLDGMSREEKEALKAQNEDLKAFQQAEETEEALKSVPRLALSDIDPECEKYSYTVSELGDNTLLSYTADTHGILYLKLLFPLEHIAQEDIPYVTMLTEILGSVDPAKRTYEQMGNAVNLHTGGIGMSLQIAQHELSDCRPYFKVIGKCFKNEFGAMLELIREQLLESSLSDTKRLKELISEMASRMEMRLQDNGHQVAANRAMAGFSSASAYKELTQGLPYFRKIQEINTAFTDHKEELILTLERLVRSVFRRGSMLLHITQEEDCKQETAEALSNWLRTFPAGEEPVSPEAKAALRKEKTAFLSSAKIQYVAVAGTFSAPFTGSMYVLRSILSNDYLWNNVRVLGGAYGCMLNVSRQGSWYIVSYRDPGLTETLDVYEKLLDYVRGFDCTQAEMDKYIIGTISRLSTPMTVSMKGSMTLDMYLNHITNNMLQQARSEVLATTQADIRALADTLAETVSGRYLCVYGNEEKLKENTQLFDTMEKAI